MTFHKYKAPAIPLYFRVSHTSKLKTHNSLIPQPQRCTPSLHPSSRPAPHLPHKRAPSHPEGLACLTSSEANYLATAWLHIWDTNAVSSLADLTPILSSDIASYDESYGGPTIGINALLAELIAPGNYTTTDVKQFPLFVIHSCDQVVTRWGYTALTTGYESTVPVGTLVELKGIEILHVDLKTRLIFNATSSADWINLARQLGETVNI